MERTFQIDFYELAFLAEACIPPRPIARAMFWQHLTDQYWHQMSEAQRAHLFNWLQKNPYYEESLIEQEDTQIFHARFDPNNQYLIHTDYKGKKDTQRAFKLNDRYYISRTTSILENYITEIEHLKINTEYK